VDLKVVIEESVRLLRSTLPARLSLDTECEECVPHVLADPTQIQQVLINLATNAMQAMRGETGRVVLRLGLMDLEQAFEQGHTEIRPLLKRRLGPLVHVSVEDNGTGMSPETVQRVFEPFFTTKPVGEGTGLGLSVAHSIVASHEGTLLVDSILAQGTTFHMYLESVHSDSGEQRAADNALSEPEGNRSLHAPSGKHILYLDDDENVSQLVKRMLERDGHRVSAFTLQSEALALLRQDPAQFDLVLSDYNMPGQSGLDVAREVRQLRKELPVAIVSGFIDETLRAQAHDAGVRALLFKAMDMHAFCASIHELLLARSDPGTA
jgi:CheY-like chemotaxis protein